MISGLMVLAPSKVKAAPVDGWIEGTITDGINPVANAFVLYMPLMGIGGVMGTGWTDLSGYYNLTVIGGFQYWVMAFHGGYWGVNASVMVNPGETVVHDFVMTSISPAVADVTLQGFVTDELGNPVTTGTVVGYASDPGNMGEGPPLYANTTAPDVLGYYSLNVIPSTVGGGAAMFEVPGYPMVENRTSNPFVSGNTYWFNITLQPQVYTDDATVYGYVTEAGTGLPIANAMVSFESWNQWNENNSYSNWTFTDSSGYYEMNVTNGSAKMWFSAFGYSMYQYEDLSIPPGSLMQFDAQLLKTTATIRGNVTQFLSGSPIADAQVFLTDGDRNFTVATTNGTGEYVLDAFNGTGLYLVAEARGFGRNMTIIDVLPGDTLWHDFALKVLDAWLGGTITDSFSGLPIQDAGVWVYNGSDSYYTRTNAAGWYNITALMSGQYSVDINAMNYRPYSGMVDVAPGGNIVNASLTPWTLPRTCKLWGYGNDSVTLMGIQNARVEIGLGPPEYSEYNQTWTNATGYYEMWVPPVLLQYVISAEDHIHQEGSFNASGLTEYRLDVTLGSDVWPPNLTYDQSPLENVSWTNPTVYNIVVEEIDPSQFALAEFRFYGSLAGMDHYYLVAMYADDFNPLSQSSDDLPYLQAGDNYTISYTWDATIMGGWLQNSTDQVYLGAWQIWWESNMYYALRGRYYNSTITWGEEGTAVFDGLSGNLVMFSFDDRMYEPALPTDATGMIAIEVSEITVDPMGGGWSWMSGLTMGNWSVVDLNFLYDPIVPSGRYGTVFAASDFAGHVWGVLETMMVDNDPPEAVALPLYQTVVQNTSASFDGSGSRDNVGVVNYTWSFTDNGVPIEVYGATASYNFTELGNHTVTLTVRDGAGHTDSSAISVMVNPDEPPKADAGSDQTVMGGDLVFFDGTLSADDVGIVNWSWTFVYDGSPVTLYGPNPAFVFWIEGLYNVTLTVRDTSGQTSTDWVEITVAGMIPEFPTLLLPAIGLAGLVLFTRLRKKR